MAMESQRNPEPSPADFAGLSAFGQATRERIERSSGAEGVQLGELGEGSRVRVRTANRSYELEFRGGQVWISGHPEYCPHPVPVKVRGSGWGGSMLRMAFLGPGLRMEFEHPVFATITTSPIVSVRTA